MNIDQEVQKLCESLDELNKIQVMKEKVEQLSNQQNSDRQQLQDKVKETILKERKHWDNEMCKLRVRHLLKVKTALLTKRSKLWLF